MKLSQTHTSSSAGSFLHWAGSRIVQVATAASLALGAAQYSSAATMDTMSVVTASADQGGESFAFPVKVNNTTIPAENPIMLFAKRSNRADGTTSVDLSSFFEMTAVDTSNQPRLIALKKEIFIDLIKGAAGKFPNKQNIIHLHCGPACAQALQNMNIRVDGYLIVWDTALWVWSQNVLSVGPKSLNNISIPAEFINTNPEAALAIAGVTGLALWGLGLAGGALWNRRRRWVPPAADAPVVPAAEIATTTDADKTLGKDPTAEGVVDAGDISAENSTELNKDYLLGSILEPLGIFHDNITVVEKDGLTELDVRIGDDDLSIGVTSRVLTYYLYKNDLPLKTGGTWGKEGEDADDIGASFLSTTLQSIIRWKETAPVDILTGTGVNIENIADTTGEMRDTIESIRVTLESGWYGGVLDFSIPTYAGKTKWDLRVTTFTSYDKGQIILNVDSVWNISIRIGEDVLFENTFVPFATARDALISFGRPTSTDSTSAT